MSVAPCSKGISSGRDHYVLGVAAVAVVAQHGGGVLAELLVTRAAAVAVSAGDVVVQGHPVTHASPCYVCAHLLQNARHLVAQRHREWVDGGLARPVVHVRVADARSPY